MKLKFNYIKDIKFYKIFIISILFVSSFNNSFTQVVKFPDTPCDSISFKRYELMNLSNSPLILDQITFVDNKFFFLKDVIFPITLAPGEDIFINVCFGPKSRGNVSDVMEYKDNISKKSIRVEGKGISSEITSNPSVLSFPRTNVGNTSAPLTTLIKNIGERPITLNNSNVKISAPYNLITLLPKILNPGDTTTFFITFSPKLAGVYSQTMDITSGCGLLNPVGLNGSTDVTGTGAIIQVSKLNFNPSQPETLFCGKDTCTKFIVQNVGTSTLKVDSLYFISNETLGFFINPRVPTPFFIPPNSKKEIPICFKGKGSGLINDSIRISSNSRNPIAFGLVLDESGSMNTQLNCNTQRTTRIEQMKSQANNFIKNALINLPSAFVVDELSVKTCSIRPRGGSNVQDSLRTLQALVPVTNIIKTNVTNSISQITANGGTSTRLVIRKMIAELSKSKLLKKVLIVITDASSTGGSEPEDIQKNPEDVIIKEANAAGVIIFPIGIGTDDFAKTSMARIAKGTKGLSFDVSDCGNLQTAFETITSTLSEGSTSLEPFSVKLSAPQLSSSIIEFDSVAIGDTLCKKIFVTNDGLGDAVIESFRLADLNGVLTNEYFIKSVKAPIVIQEKQQYNFEICFAPNKIRIRDARLTIKYNSCNGENLAPKLSGIGVAEVGLSISGLRLVKPGDIINVPVFLGSSITRFDVKSLIFGTRWNKSMLQFNRIISGVAGSTSNFTITKPSYILDKYSNIEISATTNKFNQSGELVKFEFLVLRGDTLSTQIEINYGKFDDGNPRARLYDTAALVVYDSTCFRNAIPIFDVKNQNANYKISIGEVTPNPINDGKSKIEIVADKKGMIRYDIFNINGEQVSETKAILIEEGSNSIELINKQLSSGVYYIRFLITNEKFLTKKMIVVKN
ncbi:MAG: choice-of-anchor D domain-containing protein [Chlorobiota bacterium]|nr:choice-of-anchor D domain-containing protein [Chlorobiota bacterium]QQS65477.1 MAG: choice-of-anchor D domain-containing protein [Chlorobiota bacterium]